jgi:hypothetical protein
MSDRDEPRSERENRVGEAVAWYYRATEEGSPPNPADFLARFPDVRPELESFLADKDAFDQAAEPFADELPDPDATLPPAQNPNTDTTPHTPAGDPTATVPPSVTENAEDRTTGFVRYFGDYELLAEIARGGMGVVFRARQVSLNREVALKMILTGQLASAADVARFKAEAEAAANLDYPNILPIYEIGEHLGQQYFAMKYVPGGSLAGKVADCVKDTRAAVALLVKVCRAVDFAHRRGILHRDLKPGNILLDAGGTPYVTDFGLAKKVEGDSNLTQSGAIVGTPSYMAPEQARAEKGLTTAVDTYALGAILYELLIGQPPFRGQTVLDTILQVIEKDAPDPRDGKPEGRPGSFGDRVEVPGERPGQAVRVGCRSGRRSRPMAGRRADCRPASGKGRACPEVDPTEPGAVDGDRGSGAGSRGWIDSLDGLWDMGDGKCSNGPRGD